VDGPGVPRLDDDGISGPETVQIEERRSPANAVSCERRVPPFAGHRRSAVVAGALGQFDLGRPLDDDSRVAVAPGQWGRCSTANGSPTPTSITPGVNRAVLPGAGPTVGASAHCSWICWSSRSWSRAANRSVTQTSYTTKSRQITPESDQRLARAAHQRAAQVAPSTRWIVDAAVLVGPEIDAHRGSCLPVCAGPGGRLSGAASRQATSWWWSPARRRGVFRRRRAGGSEK